MADITEKITANQFASLAGEVIKKRAHPESDLQRACVKWYKLQYGQFPIIKLDNEGKRTPQAGQIAKDMGLYPGAPDTLICTPSGAWHGLFVEFKSKAGKLSDTQKIAHLKLDHAGYMVATVNSIEAFMEVVNSYFKLKNKKS